MVFSFAVAILVASRSISRNLAFAIFVGSTSLHGPLAADTMFHPEARATFNAALCMYHDQALIPIKTIDFHGGVNITLGLPFVRTSPDHGTAFAIAGRGTAHAESLIAALRLAAEMAAKRASLAKRAKRTSTI